MQKIVGALFDSFRAEVREAKAVGGVVRRPVQPADCAPQQVRCDLVRPFILAFQEGTLGDFGCGRRVPQGSRVDLSSPDERGPDTLAETALSLGPPTCLHPADNLAKMRVHAPPIPTAPHAFARPTHPCPLPPHPTPPPPH